ncbi:MAG: hypothetical protein E7065_10810, partial [Lentimicrobiaceae bacterium]|nr:hypothetical protein [Lentimicrobiaceae bacterium]
MKRLFLFAMMCLFGLFGSINAQTVDLVIGEEGTTSNANVPFYTYYNYSISQQIYTADEMWNLSESTISTIGFKQFDSSVRTRNIAIYLLNTDRTSFTYYGSDWEPVTEADLVFSGQVTTPGVAGAWMDIELQTPFHYTGGNVLVCVLDNTGSWVSASSFYTYNAGYSVRNMYAFRDPSAYDPANPGVSGNHSMDWGSGNYRNNVIKFNATVPADFASLTVAPETIDLGARPNGAWMRPAEVVVGTKAFSLDINAVEPTDSYFQVSDAEYPAHVTTKQALELDIVHGEAEGTVNAQLAISYNNSRAIELVDMTAFAYNPAANDVFETAEEIASYPFSATPDMATVYDNYQLPGYEQDGKDVVYAMEFDNDVVLSANVTGYNGKVAVYTEDFAGEEGPMADNNYEGPEVGYAPIPAPTKFSYDFEWANTDGWDIIDADEDGYKWQSSYYTLGYPGGFGHNSEFCMTSLSYAYMPLDPDNYMVTEEKYSIFPTSELSFWVATAAMYPSEHYGVAVSTDGENFTTIYEETYGEWKGGDRDRDQDNGLSDWKQVVVSLADYAGQEIYVAIRHFNSADNYVLCVDDIELSKYGAKRGNAINEMVLPAGKYYVAASSTEAFTLNVNAETIPVPEKAYNPSPSNGAQDLQDPNLSWTFGKYTVEYQLLFGTTYPPKDVYVDWTDNLEIGHVIRDLYNNKNYFWQVNARNSSGTTYGDVWGFTTTLNVPTDLALTSANIYEGETTTLSWEAVADRSHRGYNVYVNGEKYNNTPVAETSYELAGLEYNMNGHQVSVTAVYDEGESALSNPVYVYVTGMTEIAGNIFEQDGVTPIAGGTISINGTDEIGNPASYTFQADANGAYAGEILAGNYIGTASVDLYQNKDVEFTAVYGETNVVNFSMYEVFNPVKYVDVTIIDSSNPDPEDPEDPDQPETELYRIKTYAGQYLHVFNNTMHESGPFGGVGVAAYSDSNAQLFEIEENGSNVYLKSADGYYVKCWSWNVDAYSTTDKTALVMEDNGNGTFRIKNTDNYKYFKVEYVADGGQTFVFGDCDGSNGTIENWTLEPAQTRDGDAVQVVWGMQQYGGPVEDFETGDFSANEWNNAVSSYPWEIVEGGFESDYAMKSTCEGVNNGVSAIEITVEVPYNGVMGFNYKVSSEQAWDLGNFYIDGVSVMSASGQTDWLYKQVEVAEGTHTYRWEFSKDSSDIFEVGDDAFFIDNITFYAEKEPFTGGWLHYDDGTYATSVGTGSPSPCYWGVTFPASEEYAGYTINKVAVYDASPDYAGTYTANIYVGGTDAPGTLVSSQAATLTGVGDFVEIELSTPVTIDGTQPFWVTFYTADITYPAAGCAFVNLNSDWISLDGATWNHASIEYGLSYTWMVRAYLGNAKGQTAMLTTSSNAPKFEGGASTGTFVAAENVTPKYVGVPANETTSEPTRAFSSYNLYKKSLYGTEELLAEKTTDTSFVDYTWATAEPGVYQWGVSALYEGNRGELVFSENFNNGMPAGWTIHTVYSYAYYMPNGDWYVAESFSTGYDEGYTAYDGQSAFSMSTYIPGGTETYLVTPVMEIKAKSSLSFNYINPYYGADYSMLTVNVSDSPTGPWTEIWTTGPNNATSQTEYDWREVVVDLADYAGTGKYIAFGHRVPEGSSYGGWGVAVDNVSISAEASESEILWSKPLDKDMNTTVTVTAATDNGDPVSGTKVTFTNLVEEGIVYTANIDAATGSCTFDNFRKGTYELTVAKNGFISNFDAVVVEIWDASQFNAFLTEDPAAVEGLYVSPTGWAMWQGGAIGAGEEFAYSFEDGMEGWTTIDANNDAHTWYHNSLAGDHGTLSADSHTGAGHLMSESYCNASWTSIEPDDYIVSPSQVAIGGGSVLRFWACAQDVNYQA